MSDTSPRKQAAYFRFKFRVIRIKPPNHFRLKCLHSGVRRLSHISTTKKAPARKRPRAHGFAASAA
jgi:hypothetical protein